MFVWLVWFFGFFFFFPPHLESWLFSPRALSFISQPSYSTEDTGSTGLGSYCSKGKLLSMAFLPIIQVSDVSGPRFSDTSCLLSTVQ